jgi:hypothetical protein
MKSQVKKVLHHPTIIDTNIMKKYQPIITITNLRVIIHLLPLLFPIIDDDHHRKMLIIQVDQQQRK